MAMLSSPLAAMQPPPRWGCARDTSDNRQAQASSLASGTFNFTELCMRKSQPDYFSLKSGGIRGSSPTASLAADLSQNFYIDQSPRVQTPRRCLFQSGSALFPSFSQREGATTPGRWESVTTPPIPSSSPAGGIDNMDISPLPHKPPFSLASSKPECRGLESSSDLATNTVEFPKLDQRPTFAERKRSHILRRPSLNRSKCQSTSVIPQYNQLPAFTFGAGGSASSTMTTTMSLDECFKDSPPQRSDLFTTGPIRSKSQFTALSSSRFHGSPVQNLTKRLAPSEHRPRKQFRRTLSMFEHPADIMKTEKKTSGLDVVMDVDVVEAPPLSLPNFISQDKPDSLPRINQETMISVLNGDYKEMFDNMMVIDCRFEYEFNGGHIDGALNFNDKEKLSRQLFANPEGQRTLIVLHCEYSAHRAPLMAQHIRQQDRTHNALQYPKLTYPEMYILDGGYSSFFKNHRSRCFPQNYVEMDAKEHERACEQGLNKIRQRSKSKLSRAKTFAFGERMGKILESPSRCNTGSKDEDDVDMLSGSRFPAARRMASY